MIRNAEADSAVGADDGLGGGRGCAQDDRERTRKIFRDERFRDGTSLPESEDVTHLGDRNRDRRASRTALRGEESIDRSALERIRGQAVDRVGRVDDEPSGRQDLADATERRHVEHVLRAERLREDGDRHGCAMTRRIKALAAYTYNR